MGSGDRNDTLIGGIDKIQWRVHDHTHGGRLWFVGSGYLGQKGEDGINWGALDTSFGMECDHALVNQGFYHDELMVVTSQHQMIDGFTVDVMVVRPWCI